MKIRKPIFILLLTLGGLVGAYFLIRPFWRLPFDLVSPFEAISATTGLAIGLDVFNDKTDSLRTQDQSEFLRDQLWALEVEGLKTMLDSFGMAESSLWEEWWMLPKQVEQGGEMTYTFIGNGNSRWLEKWNNSKIGIPMNFGDGNVFGFGVDSPDPIYFTSVHNLFIAGKYPFQIEEILNLFENKNSTWRANDGFTSIEKIAKDRETYSVIINCNELEAGIPNHWMPKRQKNKLAKHFDWIWLELGQIDSIGIVEAYLKSKIPVKKTKPQPNAWQWIPDICESAYPLYLLNNSKPKEWTQFIQPWLGEGGWELILAQNRETDSFAHEIWILPIADTTVFRNQYNALLKNIGFIDQLNYHSFQLKQLRNTDLLSPLTDRKGLQPWVCEVDGALICAVSFKELERWLDYYMVGGSIDKNADFLVQQKELKGNNSQLLERWPPLLDQETNLFELFYPNQDWTNSGQLLADIEIDAQASFMHLKGSIHSYEKRVTGPTIAWTLPLQMQGEIELLPVRNINTNEIVAVVLQDDKGHLLFLDNNANVFWEKEGVSLLKGDLYALPWHNDLVHLLGVSNDRLYLWDENGEERDVFPNMASPLTSTISIARLGNNEQIAIFVAAIDGKIWGLQTNGEQLKSWPIQLKSDSSTYVKILHHQSPTVDFITVWSDSIGWLGFNGQGETIFEVKGLPEKPISPAFGQQLTDDKQALNNRLVITYETGIAQIVGFTGETFNVLLGRGPVDHFLFSPIWGDPRADYVVQRGQLVHLFGYENEQLTERWQHYFSHVPDTLIDMAPFGIIVQDFKRKEIWLLDGNGQLLSDFPLAGEKNSILLKTPDQKHLLVTLLDKHLYAYQLNW